MLTTKQLAAKYNTSMQAIRQSKYERGHFKGYQPCGYADNGGQYIWDKSFKESVSDSTTERAD